MSKPYLLGIDQGTSGSKAIVLDEAGNVAGYGMRPLARIYPQPGWVEQNPQAVAQGVAEAITEAVGPAGCGPAYTPPLSRSSAAAFPVPRPGQAGAEDDALG